MARRRDHNLNDEWDKHNKDSNNSTLNNQFADEDANGAQLDHHRLYIRNFPPTLSEDGLRTIFCKYGDLNELYMSRDPGKKFALVRYENPGDAKLAMSVLNNTQPFFFHITVAYKNRSSAAGRVSGAADGFRARNNREDSCSTNSVKGDSKKADLSHTEEMEDLMPTLDDLDPDIKMRDIELELERLQVQEQAVILRKQLLQLESARKKNLSQNLPGSTNRCVMPDGRIVVRNSSDNRKADRDSEGNFISGADDQLTVPALQRAASRACVTCGGGADSYCAQCGVTPYCSVQCQRRDWAERHRSVCHNLARLTKKESNAVAEVPSIPLAAPLRRPHSPMKRDAPRRDESGSTDRDQKATGGFNRQTDARQGNRTNHNQNNRNMNGNHNQGGGYGNQNQNQNRNYNNSNGPARRFNKPAGAGARPREDQGIEEEWGSKDANTSPATAKPVENSSEPAKPVTANHQQAATATPAPAKPPVAAVKAPGSLVDVTPAKKLVPKSYLVEMLSVGDSVLLSVDSAAAECRSKREGFVCLSMHEKFEQEYQALCETYVVACETDKEDFVPKPGEAFSYFNAEDSGWYRARCLSPSLAALLDSCKLVPLGKGEKMRRLMAEYEAAPEFCCLLNAKGVKVGDNLKCTLVGKITDGFTVSLENVESGANVGNGEVSRWLPTVDYPAPTPAKGPLKEPPAKGQTVIGKYSDGNFYRALCKRTNVAKNKYMLEYIDFGNMDITQLENIYACPAELAIPATPAEASQAALQMAWSGDFSAPALDYIRKLSDNTVELVLKLPSGAKTAASGSAVLLTVAKTGENVNKTLEDMCTPDWKKMEMRGEDVVKSARLMYSDVEHAVLPETGCTLEVLDISGFDTGTLSVCKKDSDRAKYVANELPNKLAAYCDSELGKEPYLPIVEELCVAKFSADDKWYRAVVLEHTPGAATAKVCYLDYGNVDDVPVALLRKMLPEFVRGEPALASNVDVNDFPENITADMLARGVQYMKIDDEGRGVLEVTSCKGHSEAGLYKVEAKGLITAMLGK